jgi:4-aminobutyrate aminotransferase-like enzyme/Ser/Thr protein kinase RdoA (MazF antagonist)
MQVTFETPDVPAALAADLAARVFGVHGTATPLPSERDRNHLITAADGGRFVLKIANASDDPAVIDLQNAALAHVGARTATVRVARVCPTLAGEPVAAITGLDGATHLVRLLSWIPGRVLARVSPHTPALLQSLGAAVAEVDRALLDFEHAAARRALKWDLARAGWAREYLDAVPDAHRRGIATRVLDAFDTRVQPQLALLRAGVIYNDGNDHNVLVDGPGPLDQRVVGLIDFGDLVHSNLVADLAIAAAYALLDKPDPVEAVAHVAAGFHSVLPLEEEEIEVLDTLVRTRLAVSVVNAAWQRRSSPGNEYLTISEQPAWDALERLERVPPTLARAAYRHACGYAPSPDGARLATWLARDGAAFGALLDPDPRRAVALVFDLGVGSAELGLRPSADVTAFARALFGRMAEAGASIGVGRYDEARALYGSHLFELQGNDGPEARTVHLGLDLFTAPGTPVLAPLDGVVHSVADNVRPLDYGPTVILEHRVAPGLVFHTLYGHLAPDALGLAPGTAVRRGDRLGTVGAPPRNGGWPPHLHFQVIADLLGMAGDFPGVGLARDRAIWLSLCPDPNLVAGLSVETTAPRPPAPDPLLAARRSVLPANLSVSYRRPLAIVRGEGQFLFDAEGRRYLDAVNNVPHVGHCHPRVVAAGQRQMAVLNTNTRYLHELILEYARRLTATLPEPLGVCFFVNSGSEANELALRLARAHTGRRDMAVVQAGYHGHTTSLIEISSYKFDGPGGAGAPPWVHVVPIPDDYRGRHRRGDPEAGAKYAAHVRDAATAAARAGGGLAGFICESILSCGGQVVLPPGYLAESYRHVRAAGGVCVADEVQVGFGRSGAHFWAFETQGVVPDIVTMGKPIGNGHPLAAVVTTEAIARSFANGMEYFNTFGGNPVSCAIGLAVLDVMEEEGLQQCARAVGAHLSAGLRAVAGRHPVVGDVRGPGLFVGVELVCDRETREPATRQAAYVANRMRDRGVLVSTDGPYSNVIKIKPPMVFDERDADRLVETLDAVLAEDGAAPGAWTA